MEQFVYYLIVSVVGYLSGKSSKVVKQRITERRSEQLRKIAEEVVLYVRPTVTFSKDSSFNRIDLDVYGSGFESGEKFANGLLRGLSTKEFKVLRSHLIATGKCTIEDRVKDGRCSDERAQKLISKVNGDKQ